MQTSLYSSHYFACGISEGDFVFPLCKNPHSLCCSAKYLCKQLLQNKLFLCNSKRQASVSAVTALLGNGIFQGPAGVAGSGGIRVVSICGHWRSGAVKI